MLRTKKLASKLWLGGLLIGVLSFVVLAAPALVAAQDAAAPAAEATAETAAAVPAAGVDPAAFEELKGKSDSMKLALDTVWVLFTAFLVFWMNAGFALVEAGLCRAKNASTILAKNFIVFCAATVAFWFFGFNFMFGNGGDWLGKIAFFLGGAEDYHSLDWTIVPLEAKFFFQLVFAGTAATIVSGCVDERNKYLSFIIFSAVLTAVIYPVPRHRVW